VIVSALTFTFQVKCTIILADLVLNLLVVVCAEICRNAGVFYLMLTRRFPDSSMLYSFNLDVKTSKQKS